MLIIDIIEAKPYRTNPNTKISLLDLVIPSWDPRFIEYELKSIAIVTDETEMRPDLVALSYMSEASNLGTLLKINNISNPLSLLRGEVLLVPTDKMKKSLFNTGQAINNQKQKAKSFRKELQEKISQVSQERLEYLNSKNISNLTETPLPPNMLKEGEQQILVEGGRLIFGPDIGTCRTKTKKNVSITDIKSKLAQKNIFKR
jgi:hypothetical protein